MIFFHVMFSHHFAEQLWHGSYTSFLGWVYECWAWQPDFFFTRPFLTMSRALFSLPFDI